jgi:preprotein translocase YajC subunit
MPRQRAFKRRQQVVNTIQTGMKVTTYGGIIGTVREINDKRGTVKIEIADGVLVDMLAIAVMQEFDPNKPAGEQKSD